MALNEIYLPIKKKKKRLCFSKEPKYYSEYSITKCSNLPFLDTNALICLTSLSGVGGKDVMGFEVAELPCFVTILVTSAPHLSHHVLTEHCMHFPCISDFI